MQQPLLLLFRKLLGELIPPVFSSCFLPAVSPEQHVQNFAECKGVDEKLINDFK